VLNATAFSSTSVRVFVTSGGPATITLEGQTSPPIADGGSHTFTNLASNKTYTATGTSACGSVGVSSATLECATVQMVLTAQGADAILVTNVGPTSLTTIELGGQIANLVTAGGTHLFSGLNPGQSYIAVGENACGSVGKASFVLPAAVTYCPGYRFETCGCAETGFAYFDNALKDPAATVQILACDGSTVAWIYPTAGVTGVVRHEIAYLDNNAVVGYLANTSDCAGPASCKSC